jgi:hypothetical protein
MYTIFTPERESIFSCPWLWHEIIKRKYHAKLSPSILLHKSGVTDRDTCVSKNWFETLGLKLHPHYMNL